jgi:hypothetical protein
MIKEEKHIFWIWLLIIGLVRLSLLFPHHYVDEIRLINTWIQLLLFLMTIFIAIKTHGMHRSIYIIFGLYFGFILLLFTGIFIGESIFNHATYASFYYYFYVHCFGNGFFSLLLIVYLLVDYTFRSWRTWAKYFASTLITASVLLSLFSPYWYKPFAIYKQSEYLTFIGYQTIWKSLSLTLNRPPSYSEMNDCVRSSTEISDHSRTVFLANTEYWNKSLSSNIIPDIIWNPIRVISMYLNIFIVLAFLVFLIILYLFDKPYHPYIDKIIIFLIPLFALEAFHDYSYTQTFATDNFRTLFTAGQYATVVIFVANVYILHLAFRFSVSPAGIYYEEVLQTSPTRVTRWRDEIDLYLLRAFVPKNTIQQKTISINNK